MRRATRLSPEAWKRPRSTLALVALLSIAWFAVGACSMLAVVPALFLGAVFLLPLENSDFRRVVASLLLGTALAWALLPHSILDFRAHGLRPIATSIKGCQVMALAGFPLQQISAHGGGGWRLGYSQLSDRLVHAANCGMLALAWWLALRLVPRLSASQVCLIAWLVFLPLCFYGYAGMVRWWD